MIGKRQRWEGRGGWEEDCLTMHRWPTTYWILWYLCICWKKTTKNHGFYNSVITFKYLQEIKIHILLKSQSTTIKRYMTRPQIYSCSNSLSVYCYYHPGDQWEGDAFMRVLLTIKLMGLGFWTKAFQMTRKKFRQCLMLFWYTLQWNFRYFLWKFHRVLCGLVVSLICPSRQLTWLGACTWFSLHSLPMHSIVVYVGHLLENNNSIGGHLF